MSTATLPGPAGPGPAPGDDPAPPADGAALDAYSTVVTTVARLLGPSVASLRVMVDGPGGPRQAGSGSAVTITPDGFLLTSAHVVARASRKTAGTATFADGTEAPIEVVGTDDLSDLAVLRVHPHESLAAVQLGDADRLVVGQLVVAVGNPLGFAGSVSAGVVSGLRRSMTTSSGRASRLVEDVIQTDAALHPGNSGGALAISTGQVVGINTAVVGPGIGQGLGLAVPINATTRNIIAALLAEGRVRRAYLGIAGGARPLPAALARRAGQARGIEVVSVVAGSPAGAAGLRPGDILLRLDGEPLPDVGALQRLMTGPRIGLEVPITFARDGQTEERGVRLAELPG